MSRPTRYKENNSNRDWIDEFAATSTTEETRGAFRFTIGKYLRRYGKKDDPLQEALKIQDYANRLVEFEQAALLATAMPVGFSQQNTIEPAAAIDDESPRMQAIGQNGNSGEHYDAEKLERWKGAPDWATHIVSREGKQEFARFSGRVYYRGPWPNSRCSSFIMKKNGQPGWSKLESRP